jgi:hypothetical protein
MKNSLRKKLAEIHSKHQEIEKSLSDPDVVSDIDKYKNLSVEYARLELIVKDYKKSPKGPKIGGVQTWVFRSYLGRLQYNVDCWRKSWNKVWDVDLAVRIFKAGARIGFLDNVSAYIYPRPGEETVGLDAYKMHEKEKLDHYKF